MQTYWFNFQDGHGAGTCDLRVILTTRARDTIRLPEWLYRAIYTLLAIERIGFFSSMTSTVNVYCILYVIER